MGLHASIGSLTAAVALLVISAGASGCDDNNDDGRATAADMPEPSDATTAGPEEPPPSDEPPPRAEREPLTADEARLYLARVAPVIAGRSLRYEEQQTIDDLGEGAIAPLVRAWVEEPGFAEAIRYLVQEQLHASGEREGVDYELPGNLAAEVARDRLPWSTILTADYCVAADGSHIECDTGAPYSAGVLATRAFLIANKGRFNLSRSKLMLETFACRVYPMEPNIQIPLEKERLIPMFRAETAEEQVVEEAEGGFGNGIGCYSCHSQFSAHAQLFMRFDGDGIWRADATGQQDPYGELGRSFDGLYASHMYDPFEAADESTQVFGEQVANLREAGEVMADHELFPQCTVKNLVAHAFDLGAGATDDIARTLVQSIASRATVDTDDPTIDRYVVQVFTDTRVIDAVVTSLQSE